MEKFVYPGPGIDYSMHNHSDFSDGASTLREMCEAAKKSGLKVFGMSDHWVMPPFESEECNSWRMNPARLDEYVESLQKLQKELNDETFTLKIGLEVDFFFENMDEISAHLKKYPLDYMIGSVHYSGTFSVDHDAADWADLSTAERNDICIGYWKKVYGAAASGIFDFLGHLDLPKKFALSDINNADYFPLAAKALDAAAASQTPIELNTAGWFKPCNEPYPSLEILKMAQARKVPVIINADAHHCDHVKRAFDRAAALLKEAGF